MMKSGMAALLGLLVLAGCGGSSTVANPVEPTPDRGPAIEVEGFEAYVTNHNGYSRTRRDISLVRDAQALRQIDRIDPGDPAGYRDLIAHNEALRQRYGIGANNRMVFEIVATIDQDGDTVNRLVRLTADHSPLVAARAGAPVAANGVYYMRGHNFSWVTIDDGPLLSGEHARGLEDMRIDFENGVVDISLRSEGGVEATITAEGLPFNIRSGDYGGEVLITVRDRTDNTDLAVDGHLRGSVGGSPEVDADGNHDLSTVGLYHADGTDTATGRRVRVEGGYVGMDPRLLPAVDD